MTALYDEALAVTGINVAQFSLMRNIASKAPVSLTELGRMTELDRSTVGRNVRVLERMGFVVMSSGADHREQTLDLTEQGRQVLVEARPLWKDAQYKIEARLGADGPARLPVLLQSL